MDDGSCDESVIDNNNKSDESVIDNNNAVKKRPVEDSSELLLLLFAVKCARTATDYSQVAWKDLAWKALELSVRRAREKDKLLIWLSERNSEYGPMKGH